MLTVRELLRDLDVRLLCGEATTDLPVRWVHISELNDPTPWLSGGELADHQLAGLGFGVGFGHREVPAALMQAATEREFPVFEVPYEVPFIAVTEAAFTQLVNEQYAVLRRALSAHERLERVVLSQRGLEALAGTLATLIGAAVLVFDARGEPLAQRAFRRAIEPEAVTALHDELYERRTRTHPHRAFLPSHAGLADRSLALPVVGDGVNGNGNGNRERLPEAWLVAVKDGHPPARAARGGRSSGGRGRGPAQLPRGALRGGGGRPGDRGPRRRPDGAANGNPTHPSPGHHVATYRDLGSFQLLLSLQEDEALRLFCDSILGPIEACEGHYGGELMRSLEAFIEENGQWERAAKRLYCHRHTLRYRIRRVEELTGRDLHSARDRIEFWLALRGRELVA